MTIALSANTPRVSYTVNAGATQTAFTVNFEFFDDADLNFYVDGTLKTLTTHYTVAGGDGAVGTINTTAGNTVTGITGNSTIVITRSIDLARVTDFPSSGAFQIGTLNTELDRFTAIASDLNDDISRSIKLADEDDAVNLELPLTANRALRTLGFDSSGALTTTSDFIQIGGDAAQFTYSTTTTDADPGSGFIRFNHATLASASIAYIDDNEINGTDVSAWVLSFDDVSSSPSNRGRIRMSKSNTLDTWAVYKISGASTDASGYVKLALTYIDSAGTFANNDKVFLSFVATGAGETGATGAAGGSAADDISLGDAAVTIATSAGNITIDAQGSDTDIIFKGTDGASDITPLTLDMSDAGKAIFTGAATIGTTLGVTGITTLGNNLIIPNGGNIGSVGDTDAMAISSSGVVTFTQSPIGAGGPSRSIIGGLNITNDGTDADHDLGIAVGFAQDYADAVTMTLSGALIKRIDATWAVGTNNGGLDTGTVAASALYGVYLIRRSDTGVVDVLFSLDTTIALSTGTKPTNYDQWRLIGLCWTDASNNISPMIQTGDVFQKLDFVLDVNDTSITNNTWEDATMRCPPLCIVYLICRHYNNGSGGYGHHIDLQTKGHSKTAVEEDAMANVNGGGASGGIHIDAVSALLHVTVNADKQIQYNSREQTGATTLSLAVFSVHMITRSNI